MNYKTISEKIHNSVQTISLNRPDRLNAWTEEMAVEIKESMHNASINNDVKVIVLTGTGRGFCAGADMNNLNTIDADERAEKNAESPYSPFDSNWPLDFQRAQTWFPSVPKPIIAAINGPAAGLGLILSMWCDIRFASKSAIFSTAFSKRGLVAEHGISWLLPRLVGIGHAMDMTLSARKISADEAEKIGFVNKTFSDEIFLEEVYKYAESLAHILPGYTVHYSEYIEGMFLLPDTIKCFSFGDGGIVLERWDRHVFQKGHFFINFSAHK
jgi:enoyl-CoA hydratase/carnithine racemase